MNRTARTDRDDRPADPPRRPGRTGAPPNRRPRSARRALRREVPGTVGVLVDPQDFAAMCTYRTFPFDDHTAYLREIEGLLREFDARGLRTSLALFDPAEFGEFCAERKLDPDSAEARTHFTAEIAAAGATVPYTGQPLERLLPLLVSRVVRRATWEYATVLLADLGACAECGQDIGGSAFDRASHLLLRLLEAAGPGTHHIVCSIRSTDDRLLAVLHTRQDGGPPPVLSPAEGTELATVLAVGIALEAPGGIVLRTSSPDTPDRVHGWRLDRGSLLPLTAGEVFAAYCTDAGTGEPVGPEPGVDYRAGFDIGAEVPRPHH
ncbi:hypothetical protein OG233_27270 [Streptomyces sp. NBC_01218]|uniref:hypothetical protein n=1 Tax=Streptomyces sp. NBC_01218 TaxID=2903780 RepID=UPI002E0DCDB5|nr:hypothetical protein OG233_27270 [Streptomyces sp. NBC_01218]